MRHLTVVLLVALALIAASVLPAGAQRVEKRAQAGLTFLLINPSARAAGLGDAYNSIDGEAMALFQNPSGIARIKGKGDVAFSRNQWIADISQNALAAAFKTRRYGVLGLSVAWMEHGNIFKTNIIPDARTKGYDDVGTVDVSEYVVGVAWAKQYTDKFSVGGQVKRASQKLQTSKVDVLAFDFGLAYYTGYKTSRLTMSIRNFSRETTHRTESFQLPLILRVGLAMDPIAAFSPTLAKSNSLLVIAEGTHPRDAPERLDFGVEYWYRKVLALRFGTGVNYDDRGVSAGAGLQWLDQRNRGARVDYAFTQRKANLGDVHRFTVGFSF